MGRSVGPVSWIDTQVGLDHFAARGTLSGMPERIPAQPAGTGTPGLSADEFDAPAAERGGASVVDPVVDLQTPAMAFAGQRVHFVGIGGCGLSGLARLIRDLGGLCSGSDGVASDVTRSLEADGIPVGPDDGTAEGISGASLIVASAAIPDDHPTLQRARLLSIPIRRYAEALGDVQAARTGISIAGTHGKSTTSAMLCHILIEAGIDPGFIVGANCSQIGGGSRCGAERVPFGPYEGRPGFLIAEACEFQRSFHNHRPTVALIHNVEEDHLDIYGSLEHVVEAFAIFAERVPSADLGGRLLIAHDGAHRRSITSRTYADTKTFGYSPAADYHVEADAACMTVAIHHEGHVCAEWSNPLAGEHNALNGAAAAILASWLGAPWNVIADALDSFEGLDRRMQRLGTRPVHGGVATVFDDYGHHPTEIAATLHALRVRHRPNRLICVFQPHQHSRTRFLLDEFAGSFASADIVVVPQIYFVRDSERERRRINSSDLVDRLRERDVAAMHVHPFPAVVDHLNAIARGGDLIVIMGAGPVWTIGRDFMASGPDGSRTAFVDHAPDDARADDAIKTIASS